MKNKKMNLELSGLLKQDLDVWKSLNLIETDEDMYDFNEIPSCCASHALELYVLEKDPSNDCSSISIVELIRPGLDDNFSKDLNNWKCDDGEHNDDIRAIWNLTCPTHPMFVGFM